MFLYLYLLNLNNYHFGTVFEIKVFSETFYIMKYTSALYTVSIQFLFVNI